MTVPPQSSPVKVAVLGAGTVGTQVLRLLGEHREDFAQRVGAPLEVIGIAVRDWDKDRGPHVDRSLFRDDQMQLVREADIVVEVMGGIEPARTLILEALRCGASVVTANKALLATHGVELYSMADESGVDLSFEAAVAGAVPLVRPLRDSLAGDKIERVLGIVNGTTNYILDAMTRTGESFDAALATAQELGYAEADPTADIQGHDAAAKASILASLAFHTRVRLDDVHVEGITSVTPADVQAAERMGCVLKLLSIVERVQESDGERVSARVYPVMLPASHPLATVGGAYNAVFVEAESAGRLMFYGQGAGGAPTASAVLGDLVTVARTRVLGGKGADESFYASLPIAPIDAVSNSFYLALTVRDEPGVLAQVAGILSAHSMSIATIVQEPQVEPEVSGDFAHIAIVTHRAHEVHMARTLKELQQCECVVRIESLMRVEGE